LTAAGAAEQALSTNPDRPARVSRAKPGRRRIG
jgi:hypothetical protein